MHSLPGVRSSGGVGFSRSSGGGKRVTLPTSPSHEGGKRWINGVLHGTGSIGANVGRALRDALREIVNAEGGAPSHSPTPNDKGDGSSAAPPARIYPTLTISHFAAALGPEPGSEQASSKLNLLSPTPPTPTIAYSDWVQRIFARFDSDGNGEVSRDEFIRGFEQLHVELRTLKASINGEASAAALSLLADVAFYVLFAIIVIVVFEFSLSAVIVPAGTVLVSASFAIGPTVAAIVSSLILVLVTRPFDVGDRVTASGLYGGEEMLLVRRINVMTTEFLLPTSKSVCVPNALLATMSIENFRRSPPAVVRLTVLVARSTTAAQLEAVRQRVDAHRASEPLSWARSGIALRIGGLQQQSLILLLFSASRLSWQDIPRISPASFRLWLAYLAALDGEGVDYIAPPVSVRLMKGNTDNANLYAGVSVN